MSTPRTVKPYAVHPDDQEMLMSALFEYARVLRKVKDPRNTDIYARLIARADRMHRELWENRYGEKFGGLGDT